MANLVVDLIFLAVFVVLSGMVWEAVHHTTARKAQRRKSKGTNSARSGSKPRFAGPDRINNSVKED